MTWVSLIGELTAKCHGRARHPSGIAAQRKGARGDRAQDRVYRKKCKQKNGKCAVDAAHLQANGAGVRIGVAYTFRPCAIVQGNVVRAAFVRRRGGIGKDWGEEQNKTHKKSNTLGLHHIRFLTF